MQRRISNGQSDGHWTAVIFKISYTYYNIILRNKRIERIVVAGVGHAVVYLCDFVKKKTYILNNII